LGVGWVLAVVGAGFVTGVVTFFLGMLASCAHVGAGWVVLGLGGGDEGGGGDSKVDFGVMLHGGVGMADDSHHSGDDSLP
jgi:hypothetical protein